MLNFELIMHISPLWFRKTEASTIVDSEEKFIFKLQYLILLSIKIPIHIHSLNW